jgi:hypothetical protein
MATRCPANDYFQGIFRWSARQLDGGGGFSQREPMGNEATDIQLARENEPGHFVLQREIGRVAAEQILFVHANRRRINFHDRPAFGVGEEHELSAAAQPGLRLPHHFVGGHGNDRGVESAAVRGAVDEG